MFDIAQFETAAAANEGAILTLLHPATGAVLTAADGAPVTLRLAGEDSERYRSASRAAANRRLKASQASRKLAISAEEIENDGLELLVACTIGWSGLMSGGAEFAFSPENARALYKRLPWLREQAEAFIADRANFMKA